MIVRRRIHTAIKLVLCAVLTCALAAIVLGCALPQVEGETIEGLSSTQSAIYGDWQTSTELAEEQIMRDGTEMVSSGSGRGTGDDRGRLEGSGSSGSAEGSGGSHFRDTSAGEPLAIHLFINQVLIDDEFVKITVQSKTADEFGDAGFMLKVENHYVPVTSAGKDNYCYITPVMGSWTVNGVELDPLAEGRVYPGETGYIYLYFDEFTTVEELVKVQGTFEVYRITDWWNPIGTYEFNQE